MSSYVPLTMKFVFNSLAVIDFAQEGAQELEHYVCSKIDDSSNVTSMTQSWYVWGEQKVPSAGNEVTLTKNIPWNDEYNDSNKNEFSIQSYVVITFTQLMRSATHYDLAKSTRHQLYSALYSALSSEMKPYAIGSPDRVNNALEFWQTTIPSDFNNLIAPLISDQDLAPEDIIMVLKLSPIEATIPTLFGAASAVGTITQSAEFGTHTGTESSSPATPSIQQPPATQPGPAAEKPPKVKG